MADLGIIAKKYPNGGVVLSRVLADILDDADKEGMPIERWGRENWEGLEKSLKAMFDGALDKDYIYGELTAKVKVVRGGALTQKDRTLRRDIKRHLQRVKQQSMNALASLRKRIASAQPHVREGMFNMIRDWRKDWRNPNIPEEKKTLALAAMSDQEVLKNVPSDELTMQLHQAIQTGSKSFRRESRFDYPVAQGVAGKADREERWALQLMPSEVAAARESGGMFTYAHDAEARLLDAMESYRERLSDRDSDLLYFAMDRFSQRAKHADDQVWLSLDDLMEVLGYAKHNNAGGGASYRERDKSEVRRKVEDLENQHLTVSRVLKMKTGRRWDDIQSRVFVIMDKAGGQADLDGTLRDWSSIRVAFGRAWSYRLFGDGRLVMNLHRQALAYHPTKEVYEKRLAKALSFYWRVNIDKRSVANYPMIDIVAKYLAEPPDQITRRKAERVEQALDRLQADGIIERWQYEDGTPLREVEGALPHRWRDAWLERVVQIEAPRELAVLYDEQRKNKRLTKPPQAEVVEILSDESVGLRLKRFRHNRGLSALETAKQIGIDNGTLSKIENGKLHPGPKVSRRIENWMRDLQNRPDLLRQQYDE